MGTKTKHSTILNVKELWKYSGVTGAVDEIKRKLENEIISEYDHRRLPDEHELKRYVMNSLDKRTFIEGLYWIDESIKLVDGERFFLNITKVGGEFFFVPGYFSSIAHVYIIHSKRIPLSTLQARFASYC